MTTKDRYGLPLTASANAAAAYQQGLDQLLALRTGAVAAVASSIVLDPTFALGHATLALLGHDLCADVDIPVRMRAAVRHAPAASERERSAVHAVGAHLLGDSHQIVRHLGSYPTDALLLSAAVPTIAFAGVTQVPEEAWALVEAAAPVYGEDWWFTGLLAFTRQEQGRYDEAFDLSCASLRQEPGAGHSAHARAHVHYETGDHRSGLSWMDDWVSGAGAGAESLSHFSWHAALHELSLGDLAAVRHRYDEQLRPEHAPGCRALVDSGSLLIRWALTPDATDVPGLDDVVRAVGCATLERPATPFVGMHAAATLLALGDASGLRSLADWSSAHIDPVQRTVVAPLAAALRRLLAGECSAAATALGRLARDVRRVGGSDAQRELVEEIRIAALIKADRLDEARDLLDRRLDRRRSPRDLRWRQAATMDVPETLIATAASADGAGPPST